MPSTLIVQTVPSELFHVPANAAGPDRGGLRFDYRRPKHPYSDKFMLAAGHCAPTCYALWIIMGEALHRKYQATGDRQSDEGRDVEREHTTAQGRNGAEEEEEIQ